MVDTSANANFMPVRKGNREIIDRSVDRLCYLVSRVYIVQLFSIIVLGFVGAIFLA